MRGLRTVFLGLSLAGLLLFGSLLRAGLAGDEREDLFRSLGILTEVVHLVESEYVDPLNDEALAMALDAGLLESVDPWAAVVPEGDVETYRRLVVEKPSYGLVIGGRLGSAAVRDALPGSPASKAGLQSWEVIEKIDGVYTRGRPLWQIRLELFRKEKAGEDVVLTVVDRKVDDRREVVLAAGAWSPNEVESADVRGVRVVTLRGLGPGVTDRLHEVLTEDQPTVIDLRDLVWGTGDEAVAAADLLVDQGPIASWSGRREGEKVFEATPGALCTAPPVVLVGPDTEGVGEVFASALQRNGSPLIGWTTAGHAPVMRFVESGGLHLYIPVAQWLAEDGEAIDGLGLEPAEKVDWFRDPDDPEAVDEVLEQGIERALEPTPDETELDDAA